MDINTLRSIVTLVCFVTFLGIVFWAYRKRNAARFPEDFRFQLTREELANLISQIAISSSAHGGIRKLPWAFTEHGALMAANILRSPRAVQMSVRDKGLLMLPKKEAPVIPPFDDMLAVPPRFDQQGDPKK